MSYIKLHHEVVDCTSLHIIIIIILVIIIIIIIIIEIPEKVDKEKSWYWLSRCDVKVETEALLCAAQEQALRTNYIKHHIDKSIDSPLCRMCGKCGESVQHIVSGCEKLAQKEYKRRHDNVAKKIHWDLCKKHDLEHQEKWYDHIPEGAVENDKSNFFGT